MAEEPYFTPGQSDGVPPQSPTEFSPEKPLGPDPVSPQPLAEGSESEKHAQLFAFDPASGNFKPIEWNAGKLKVDLAISGVTVEIDWTDQYFTVIQTHIERDPLTGLVSLIAETDGVRTKNTIFIRDSFGRVEDIQEALVP